MESICLTMCSFNNDNYTLKERSIISIKEMKYKLFILHLPTVKMAFKNLFKS